MDLQRIRQEAFDDGFETAAELGRRRSQAARLRKVASYPVRYLEIAGVTRAVRGYPGGRYGYWDEDGVFVDLEPAA